MALLNIRQLPKSVHSALRVRAAKAGRSMEAEAREILVAACLPRAEDSVQKVQALVDQMFKNQKPKRVVDALIRERRREAKKE